MLIFFVKCVNVSEENGEKKMRVSASCRGKSALEKNVRGSTEEGNMNIEKERKKMRLT